MCHFTALSHYASRTSSKANRQLSIRHFLKTQTLSSWEVKLFLALTSREAKLLLPYFLQQTTTAHFFSNFSSRYFTQSTNSSCDGTPSPRQTFFHLLLSMQLPSLQILSLEWSIFPFKKDHSSPRHLSSSTWLLLLGLGLTQEL